MKKLKEKWGIKSNSQLIVILIVFSITGAMAVIIAKPLLNLLEISSSNTNLWLYIPIRLLIIFPLYQILILIIGALFGQFQFFWRFEKKMLHRIGFKKMKK